MSQPRLHSFVEAWINVLIGFGVSFAANMLILPMFGYNVSVNHALGIGLWFTVVSVIRGYAVRRLFNRMYRRSR